MDTTEPQPLLAMHSAIRNVLNEDSEEMEGPGLYIPIVHLYVDLSEGSEVGPGIRHHVKERLPLKTESHRTRKYNGHIPYNH